MVELYQHIIPPPSSNPQVLFFHESIATILGLGNSVAVGVGVSVGATSVAVGIGVNVGATSVAVGIGVNVGATSVAVGTGVSDWRDATCAAGNGVDGDVALGVFFTGGGG